MTYTTIQVAEIVQGTISDDLELTINKVFIDSREISPSDDAVFFALKGERNDGHDFISDLYGRGVFSFVVNQSWYALANTEKHYSKASFIVVANSLLALQHFAAWHRASFGDKKIIGITGSNGKTIVKEWLFQLLRTDFNICRSPRSYNSQVGVPLSVFQLANEHNLGIFEAGISKYGEMARLQKMILPEIGFFTNIGTAHQENFISIKQKVAEKMLLFSNAKQLYYCSDYPEIHEAAAKLRQQNRCQLRYWSHKSEAALVVDRIIKNENYSQIKAAYLGKKIALTIPFTDKASVENCILIWLYLLHEGYYNQLINRRMTELTPIAMRMEVKEGINNCSIINDSYNSDIESLKIALNFQNRQTLEKTLIMSDILQSGRDEKELYNEVAEIVKRNEISNFVGIGDVLSRNRNLFKMLQKTEFHNSTANFLKYINTSDFKNQSILLKGARGFCFEDISMHLEKIHHRTVLEINMNNIIHNLNFYKTLLSSGVRIMVMVKAYAYGNGSFEIARLLQHQGVDYLGVAYIDEGIELRRAGITLPIMVMNPEFDSFTAMIEHNLEPEIYNIEGLQLFHLAGRKSGIKQLPVHIKIETGMHRLGFEAKDIENLLKEIDSYENIKIKSVFSHLAGSDEDTHDEFTKNQIAEFQSVCNHIGQHHSGFIRHILNSSGIGRFAEAQFDMVRLGIGLYGVGVKNTDVLQPVSKLKSVISQIKNVDAGDTIGYSRKGKINKTSRIATVAIGYADGLKRLLGNGKGHLTVNGQKAPIIGSICMDMCMIDVTGINANEGDEVVVFGNKQSKETSIEEIAEMCQTIPYEILTGIPQEIRT